MRQPKPVRRSVGASASAGAEFRIDIDLDEARRAATRVRDWLFSLRQRHDLSKFEYTHHVRIVPAGATYSHPILTLGTRFAESEDHLLSTYLHEQMHWYLYRLGGIDHDPVAPFFDELVRRYPKAPTRLPEGARNYEQTYVHLVVCWLELKAVSELIGWERAVALAETNYGYRWIYRTVVRDFEALGTLLEAHGVAPLRPAWAMATRRNGRTAQATVPARGSGRLPPGTQGRSNSHQPLEAGKGRRAKTGFQAGH